MDPDSEKIALINAAENLLAAAKEFDGTLFARTGLTKQADNLRWLSEDGGGSLLRQWETINLTSSLSILVECGIFDQIPQNSTITSTELSNITGLDESVVQRSMRLVCTQGIGEEVAPNVYSHNAKSLAYITGNGKYFFKFIREYAPVFHRLPEYFQTHSKEAFYDTKQTPYAWSLGLEGKTYYEAIAADPERLETFSKAMAQFEEQMPTLGMFPFASLKAEVEAEQDRPFIVDVGGGHGQTLKTIQEEAPAGFGAQMVLQDLPHVIDGVSQESIPNITKMAHDFYTPQPVKNAHLYLLRRVLHNYLDDSCKIILKHIVDAMGPTSRLLIAEFVLPDRAKTGGDFIMRWMDFAMIPLSGKERTQVEFEQLFEAVGLVLVKVWPFLGPGQPQSVIEAKLKAS